MTRRILGSHHLKGRGALSNPPVRFEATLVEKTDDGWYQDEEGTTSLPQTVLPDRARSVITTNNSPDVGFDQSINPYRGCSHGCVYCFARPTHAYLGLSPGLDFETKLFYKDNAVELLRADLSARNYVCKTIALGINTDGWQPLEKTMEVTRSVLAVLAECRHPISIVTKSALIVRDLDLLQDMARDRLVSVMVSITTLDNDVKRALEPRTASPQARLKVLEQLSAAGVPVGVMVAPVIPSLTDHEMEHIMEASKNAGATRAGYTLLRLPHEVKDLFREWLAEHYPDRAQHVMSIINQSRGGKDYESEFGKRMVGTGVFAELLRKRFQVAKRRLGLDEADERFNLRTDLFRPPAANRAQMTLGF
ncbi:MAG: PA0069 family radical SAM protein [Proteobacteria bacterium]|nr:PA0069 family radical SAM protein [Pseudomonadota bacterium]